MRINTSEIREYGERIDVVIDDDADGNLAYADYVGGRPVLIAYNEGGYNHTTVDILDLVQWIQKNRPEWLPPRGRLENED